MSRNIAFIHASLAVKNQHERPSLVLEDVGGISLIARLTNSLSGCTRLHEIVLVTSDQPCDDDLVAVFASQPPDENAPTTSVMRIPSGSPFAFSESNTVLDRAMLYRLPCFGLLSAEGFLSLSAQLDLATGLDIDASSSAFITTRFADHLLENAGRYGNMELFYNPTRAIIAATREGVGKMLSKHDSAHRDRVAASNRMIENEISVLKSGCMDLGNAEIETIATKKAGTVSEKRLTPLVFCFGLWKSEEGKSGHAPGFFGNEDALFSVTRETDLAKARDMFSQPGDIGFDTLIEERVQQERSSRLVSPSYVNIEITSRCNASCSFCPSPALQRPRQDMEWDLFRKIVDEAAVSSPYVALSGFGEPMLHPDILQFIRYAKDQGVMRLAVETNGTLLDENTTRDLFAAGVDFLILNMNGMISSPDPWEKKVETILSVRDEFRSSGPSAFPKVILQVVNTNSAASHMDRIFARFNFIADKVVIVPFNTYRGSFQYDGAIDFTPAQRTPCAKLMNTMFVLADGSSGLCGQFPEGALPHLSHIRETITGINSSREIRAMNAAHIARNYPAECLQCREWYMQDFGNENTPPLRTIIQRAYSYKLETLVERILTDIEHDAATGDFESAINRCEIILRNNPGNIEAKEILEQLENQLYSEGANNQ